MRYRGRLKFALSTMRHGRVIFSRASHSETRWKEQALSASSTSSLVGIAFSSSQATCKSGTEMRIIVDTHEREMKYSSVSRRYS